ncbi:hypothetical protein JOM56_003257, partial [Amanita muscaria]
MPLTWKPLLILEVFAVYCRMWTIVGKFYVNRGHTTVGRRRYKICYAKIADFMDHVPLFPLDVDTPRYLPAY